MSSTQIRDCLTAAKTQGLIRGYFEEITPFTPHVVWWTVLPRQGESVVYDDDGIAEFCEMAHAAMETMV